MTFDPGATLQPELVGCLEIASEILLFSQICNLAGLRRSCAQFASSGQRSSRCLRVAQRNHDLARGFIRSLYAAKEREEPGQLGESQV